MPGPPTGSSLGKWQEGQGRAPVYQELKRLTRCQPWKEAPLLLPPDLLASPEGAWLPVTMRATGEA